MNKSEREAALEEAVKCAKAYAAKLRELKGKNSSGVTNPEMWEARISSVDYLTVLIEGLASTPPKPAAEDVVERVAAIIEDAQKGMLTDHPLSIARALAAANLLRTDKEPS